MWYTESCDFCYQKVITKLKGYVITSSNNLHSLRLFVIFILSSFRIMRKKELLEVNIGIMRKNNTATFSVAALFAGVKRKKEIYVSTILCLKKQITYSIQ